MRLSTATWCDVIGVYEGLDALEKHLSVLYDTPFKYIDLSFAYFGAPDSIWAQKEDVWKEEIEKVGIAAEQHGYTFISSHSLNYDKYFDEETKQLRLRAIEKTMKACAMLKIPSTVIHGVDLWKEQEKSLDVLFKENKEFYSILAESAEKYGVDMLIENYDHRYVTYPFRTGRDMRDFLDYAKIPRLHAVWDTGHANSSGGPSQYEDLVALGDELHSLHVADNWGGVDCHAIPFYGTVDFSAVIRALIDIGYKGTFNFEASDMFVISSETDRGRKRHNLNIGDKLADPPRKLITEYMKLLYETGKWMLSEYNVFEE